MSTVNSMAATAARPLVLIDGARRDQVYAELRRHSPIIGRFCTMSAESA
jgi:hypothetical protein